MWGSGTDHYDRQCLVFASQIISRCYSGCNAFQFCEVRASYAGHCEEYVVLRGVREEKRREVGK